MARNNGPRRRAADEGRQIDGGADFGSACMGGFLQVGELMHREKLAARREIGLLRGAGERRQRLMLFPLFTLIYVLSVRVRSAYPLMLTNETIEYISREAIFADERSAFPESAFQRLSAEGLLKITLPHHSLGPGSRDTAGLLRLLKRIGRADLATGRIYEGHINALELVHRFARDGQKARWYADVEDHGALFGVWNTQAADGVEIRPSGDGKYRLEGCKTFCSGAHFINRPLITGALVSTDRKGWQMCVVPAASVGSLRADPSFWQPLGMRASVSYRMDLTGVEISADDLLGSVDDYYRQPVFGGGAIRFAAVQLGGAEALLEATRAFLKTAGRTADPFQKARIAEMTCLVTAGNQWLAAAGQNTDRWLQTGNKTEEIVAYANMTRTAIEEICLRTMRLAERSVGARGLMRPEVFERIHRDLTMYLRQPTPDAALASIGDYMFSRDRPVDDLWD